MFEKLRGKMGVETWVAETMEERNKRLYEVYRTTVSGTRRGALEVTTGN